MELDEGDIRIYYKGGSDPDLDDFFKLLLKLIGYQLYYTSGMDMENKVRELCFETKEVNPNA